MQNNNTDITESQNNNIKNLINYFFIKLKIWNTFITTFIGIGIMPSIIWILKLFSSQEKSQKYNIVPKYFFSYNIENLAYIFLVWSFIGLGFFLKLSNKASSIFFKMVITLYIIFLILIVSFYNKNFWWLGFVPLLLIISIICFYKEKNIEGSWLSCLGFIVMLLFSLYQNFNFDTYEFTTITSNNNIQKNVVILSEYQNKYLVVPYLKKGESVKKNENEYKLIFKNNRSLNNNIQDKTEKNSNKKEKNFINSGNLNNSNENENEKIFKCKKDYCFFTGSYEFIDKFNSIFKTTTIKNTNIDIQPQYEIEYIN